MTARLILKHPDPRLRIRSEEIVEEDWNGNVEKWCTDIKDTMKANAGLGLAAPQVGIHKRMFVIDVKDLTNPEIFEQESQDGTLYFVNPKLKFLEEESAKSIEACLSVPGVMYAVRRSPVIEFSYMTLNREEKQVCILGEDAVVIQHEQDHLDGKLFIDRLNPFDKKDFAKRNFVAKREKTEGEINQLREQKRARARKNRKK